MGIVVTLILGTLLGIARLSDNWLVRRAAGAYVEIFRNVPPLLVIIFVNSLALATLPPIEEADEYLGLLVVSVAEIGVVAPRADGNGWAYAALLLAAVAAAVVVGRWRARIEERTGAPARRWLWSGGLIVVAAVGGYAALVGPGRAVATRGRGAEHHGRRPHGPAVRRDPGRPRAVHVVARVRDRAGVDHGGAEGADRGRGGDRPVVGPAVAPRRAAAGLPHRHPADHQPVPEPHEEHVAGRRRGLRRTHGRDQHGHRQRRTRPSRRSWWRWACTWWCRSSSRSSPTWSTTGCGWSSADDRDRSPLRRPRRAAGAPRARAARPRPHAAPVGAGQPVLVAHGTRRSPS